MNTDLYKKISEVKESEIYKQFVENKGVLSSKEFRAKYPHHIVSTNR